MIRTLTPADQPALKAYLRQHVSSSMFLLNNLNYSGIVDGSQPLQGAYVGEFSGNEIIGVAAHYWNGNAMMQSVMNAPALVRAALAASKRPLVGVVGEGGQCAAVIADQGLTRSDFQLFEIEGLYALDLRQLRPPAALGHVRNARQGDFDTLVAFYTAYALESLGETNREKARATAIEDFGLRLNAESQFVLEIAGEIVAASAINAYVWPAVQIGAVWTPPPARGRGFARACVAGSLQILAKEVGVTEAILFTGDDNLAARRSYDAIGFQRIGDFFVGLLQADRANVSQSAPQVSTPL